jgi:hypothetical protein
MAKLEKLEQRNVALPPTLCAFLERQARAEDRTVSGVIRRLIAEAARHEPPAPAPSFPVLENVPHTAEGIATARARQATKREELARIEQRRRRVGAGGPISADGDMRASHLSHEIAIIDDQIAMAVRMMPRTTNGG